MADDEKTTRLPTGGAGADGVADPDAQTVPITPPRPAAAPDPADEPKPAGSQPPAPESSGSLSSGSESARSESATAGEPAASEPAGEPAPAAGPRGSLLAAVAGANGSLLAAALRQRLTGAGAIIAVLIALLGFTLVVQLRSNTTDPTLATQRQEDLVRILSDLEAKDKRLRDDISRLENSQRELNSGAQGREAALQAATERADQLGILAGTLPARGQGLRLRFEAVRKPIRAEALLDAVQELRGAQAEAMQVQGSDGQAVRIIASTSFLDKDDDVIVDGVRLRAPYTITVIGDPETMRTALNIPGGVVESVSGAGGTVIFSPAGEVDVTALHGRPTLQYAKPVS
ncbi:DUF881 domain-containing protein [Rhizomonospora bruguierae]|uniref:DUF881 domain-containing protein n=1 Tax=Rhizomonospora bruguierae TaxID=1581705 RepID=UPI001BCD6FA3|nr:DUF881 domain-containing protein [Micromonospora sp. NBRC 107566]